MKSSGACKSSFFSAASFMADLDKADSLAATTRGGFENWVQVTPSRSRFDAAKRVTVFIIGSMFRQASKRVWTSDNCCNVSSWFRSTINGSSCQSQRERK
ncbi:hypothetical protein I7I50_00197 [Histoplasma capsulatum G186AR]|uniref:Uncharacterized protein n=1 Tax=Ajellomyces capsulatus TaxID=5037 RepID=A0A8H8CTU8_AJECA|nr:hypothetical protein I7I52_07466 [Histoplasma capsulatum]QSS72374.1 hypothetical protein I7I50_00197 [Histoplasma capsulatum G186AR]